MWRDRTNLYISYRQSYAHHPRQRAKPVRLQGLSTRDAPEDRRGLLSSDPFDDDNGDAVIEMDLLPPRWADVSDDVAQLLSAITARSQRLDKLHQQHVLPGFDDEDATKKAEEAQIESLTQEITRAFHDCHGCIQRIEQLVRQAKHSGSLSRAQEIMAKNLQISLATKVQDVSASFRKKQSAYLKKLRDMGGLASPTVLDWSSAPYAASASADTHQSLQESDADRLFCQTTLQAASQQRSLHSNDAAIAQREHEIQDIAQGIIELSDLFRDLQAMVIDQGTMLDRIDYNVERMNQDVKGADQELNVASGYQRKTTKRKIILLLLILIAGLFILLIVKPKKKGTS
ncbi:hypothetical protein CDD82_7955 [Ophiocordyceps australis]|uniref:t-SNARE coiled-coil homology domain-containing protein n=1 Tax=Ophiocordyceps australis TaxID=1399860 RepID=A0A2C5YK67_9HYPO|nr:hypothetical protein CDD82_7955 [Ophiocordyceps australis]